MPANETRFRDKQGSLTVNGFLGLILHLILSIVNIRLLFTGPGAALLLITGPLWLLIWNSYVIVNPNEAVVTQFFGKYKSTIKTEGFQFFLNPFYAKLEFQRVFGLGLSVYPNR